MLNDFRDQLPEFAALPLNAGTTSPTPLPLQELHQAWRERQAAAPVDVVWRQLPAALEESRAALAKYLGAQTQNLLLLPNATFGMNTVVQNLPLHSGDVILAFDHEYHHTWNLWQELCDRTGATIRKVPWSDAAHAPHAQAADLVDRFAEHWCDRTRVVAISHITSCSGLRLPVIELCQLAREREAITVVDGAHATGHVPLQLDQLAADFYIGTSHKWLMAPVNCGYTYVNPKWRAQLRPLIMTEWSNPDPAALDEPTVFGPSRWQMAHEYYSTVDRTAQAVVKDAVAWRVAMTDDAVHRRCEELGHYACERLQAAGHALHSQRGDLASNMVTVKVPQVDPGQAWLYFHDEAKLDLAFPKQPNGEVCLRVSCAWFIGEQHIDQLVAALATAPWDKLSHQ